MIIVDGAGVGQRQSVQAHVLGHVAGGPILTSQQPIGPRRCPTCGGQTPGASAACPAGGDVHLVSGRTDLQETDLSMFGATGNWSHTRRYSSALVQAQVDGWLANVHGYGWKLELADSFAAREGTGSDVSVYGDAHAKTTFSYVSVSGHIGTYTAPAGARWDLTHYRVSDTYSGTGDAASDTVTLEDSGGGFPAASGLAGCVLKVTIDGTDELRRIVSNDTDTIIVESAFSDELDGYTYEVLGQFELRSLDGGQLYRFRDCDLDGYSGLWTANACGVLWQQSDVYAQHHTRYDYSEDTISAGRIEAVSSSDGWYVVYIYRVSKPNAGRIEQVIVYNDAGETLHGSIYTYSTRWGQSFDCGRAGELILAQVAREVQLAGSAKGTSTAAVLQIDTADRTADADALIGCQLIMRSGDNQYRSRTITDNSAVTTTSGSVTVSPALDSAPGTDDTFWIAPKTEAVHYRYYRDSGTLGKAHQMKTRFGPQAVQDIVDAKTGAGDAIVDAYDVLAQGDTFDVTQTGSRQLQTFSSQSVEYYTSDTDTSANVATPWGGSQNLSTLYGGTNVDESVGPQADRPRGFVKSRIVHSACGSCGGTEKGLKHTYFYMDLNGGPSADPAPAANVVARIVVEDITATETTEDDVKVRRIVYGLSASGQLLRKITLVDPATPQYWCESTVIGASGNSENQPEEVRQASAHTDFTKDNTNIRKFLNPTTATNDADTLNDSTGVVQLYEYNSDSRMTGRKVKKGQNGTAYYVAATDYGDGSDDQPANVVVATYNYPTVTTTRANGVQTTYAYTFWNAADTQLNTRTTSYPKVPTSENGAGDGGGDPQITSAEYYDSSGRLRWTIDPEGRVTYYAQHPDTGGTAYVMRDVETDDLPGDITSGSSGKWIAWSGGVPTGFEQTDDNAVQLVSKTEFDTDGRTTKTIDADGIVTCTVYLADQTRVYPAWDSATDKPLLPIQVSEFDEDGKTTRTYTVDPSGITISDPPDGTETLAQSAYLSLTTHTYNDAGQLLYVDRYHDIPSSGDGTIITNFFRTASKYDSQGRQTHTVQVVAKPSGGSYTVEQVSKTVYDELDRTIETYKGVSDESDDMGSGYATDPTLYQTSATFYDEATLGSGTSGVGDGNVTSTRSFYGTGANDYYKQVSKYDWRNRLEQSRGPDKVAVKYTLDHMGRTTVSETYADADEDFTQDGGEDTFSKSESVYDERGQVYQSYVYKIESGAATATKMTTKYWYSPSGRTLKVESAAGMFTKMQYDGLGRTVATFSSYDDSETTTPTYAEADDVSGDTVLRASWSEYSGTRMVGSWTGTALGTAPVASNPNGGTGGNMVRISRTWYDTDYDTTGTNKPWVTGVSTLKANLTTAPDEDDVTTAHDTYYVLTKYEYDAAGRQDETISPDPDGAGSLLKIKSTQTFDDLSRPLVTEVYKTDESATTQRIAKSETVYDSAMWATSQKVYKVAQSDGAVGAYLETIVDHDGYGRTRKVTQPSGTFTKSVYDEFRLTGTYVGTDEGGTDSALNVTTDTIVEQTVPSYDDAAGGRVWLTTSAQRNDDGTGTGALTTSNARVTYTVTWFDDAGRTSSTVVYGTNDGNVLDGQDDDFDPETADDQNYDIGAPAPNASDTYIATVFEYDGYGRGDKTTDNAGKVAKTCYSADGRRTHVVENFDDFDESDDSDTGDASDTSKDRVTKFEYHGPTTLVIKQTALDPDGDGSTADKQETRYVFAVELTDQSYHPVMDGARLRAVIYPDSDDVVASSALGNGTDSTYDRVELAYYADGAAYTRKDQRGTVRTFEHDNFGRMVKDRVTTDGDSKVDVSVRSILTDYDDRGNVSQVASYSQADPTVGTDTPVNEVVYAFDDWGPIATSWQEHAGAATTTGGSQSNRVQYAYEDGASGNVAKYVRLDTLTLPNSRAVYYNYPGSGIGSVLSRLDTIAAAASPTDAQKHAVYTYLGAGTIVKAAHPQVTGGLNLTYGTGGTYGGFDRFGRVIDQKWENDSSTVKDRFRYGYDYAGNRVWRENTQSTTRSEFYSYDGLDRLKNMDRGTLSGTHPSYSAPASPTVERDFSLDQLGNWGGYTEKLNGSATLTQMRIHNDANEIYHATYGSAITESAGSSWIDPVHDLAGNMILAPKPGDEATSSEGVVCVYDAWNRLAATYKDSDSDHDGAADASDTLIAEYQYDGLNHRIVKLVWDNTNEDWDRTDYYYTTGWQAIEERFAADVADEDKGDVATNAKYQYVWDQRYIDAPVLRDADTDSDGDCVDSGGSERLYYTNDANMNITALVATDGTIAERYTYDVYGQPTIYNSDWSSTINWASSKQNEVLFAGYRYDPETGLYQVRNRFYHPTLGRWLQRDPLGYVDGLNLYEHVRSRPIYGLDPAGLSVACDGVTDYTNWKKRKGQFIYTCRCGWLDVSHVFGWAKAVKDLHRKLAAAARDKRAFSTSLHTESGSGLADTSITISSPNVQKLAGQLINVAVGAVWIHSYLHEWAQASSPVLAPGSEILGKGSGFSGEDTVSNLIGANIGGFQLMGATEDQAIEFVVNTQCGPILSEKDAKCLCEEGSVPGTLTPALNKDGSINVLTYNTSIHAKGCRDGGGKPLSARDPGFSFMSQQASPFRVYEYDKNEELREKWKQQYAPMLQGVEFRYKVIGKSVIQYFIGA